VEGRETKRRKGGTAFKDEIHPYEEIQDYNTNDPREMEE